MPLTRSSRGICRPTTLSVRGSDLHRVCRTRLCCAFRLFRPLDALFLPSPLQPSFMLVTPLGFRFQRVSPPGSHEPLDSRAPPVVSLVSAPPTAATEVTSADFARTSRDSRGLRIRKVRTRPRRCYPDVVGRSSPSLVPLRGVHPSASAPCFHSASSHGLSLDPDRRTDRDLVSSSEC